MLSAFRAFAKSWVATVLIGILIVAFAVFGIRDVFRGRISDAVITAGSREVSPADYRRAFENIRKRAEQETGQAVTAEIAAANGLDRQVLEDLAVRESFNAWMQKIGVHPSDKLVADQLRKIPAFFDPVSGRFDEKRYREVLGENQLTPDRFLGMVRDDIAERQVASAFLTSTLAPRSYAALASLYALESRDLSYFTVTPAQVTQPTPPTDAQLIAFMKQNASQLTLPEFRVLTVVRFSPDTVGANLPIDEAKLKKTYDFKKDTLSKPETRTVVQIPAKDAATAQQIAARLSRGEAPDAIAKSLGVAAITYDDKPKTAIPDMKLAAAAFQMSAGQVQVAQGDLGTAVLKVVSVTPGHTVTFEEARPALEAEQRKQAAADKVYALTQAYDTAHQKGANVTEAAQKTGVPAMTIGPVTRDGRDQQGQPVAGLSQKLMETAFTLPAGGESDVTQAAPGEYFAVRVEKVIPPALPDLAKIKPELARAYMMRELVGAMQAKADELAARVRRGESLQAVAASAGSHVAQITGATRQAASQSQQVSQELIADLFGGKAGQVFVAHDKSFAMIVGQIGAIRPGDPAQLAQMTEQSRVQMSSTIVREIGDAAQLGARAQMKTRIDYARARAAIGLPPLKAQGKDQGKSELAK